MTYKFCPRCGGRLESKSPIMALCGRCGFEFYSVPKVTVAIILENEQEEILLGLRSKEPGKGLWDTFGGHVDPGETAEEAVRREVREEIRAEIEGLSYYRSYPDSYFYQGVKHPVLAFIFRGKVKGKPHKTQEISEVKFFAPKEIPFRTMYSETNRQGVQEYLRTRKIDKQRNQGKI